MFAITPSITNEMTLSEVTTRLAAHDVVEGVALIGSTGQEALTEHSDYDILLFMASLPVPLHVLFTTVGGVLTDVVFAEIGVLDRILTTINLPILSAQEGAIMHWLADGRIVYDRNGRLRQAQSRLQTESWNDAIDQAEALSVWQKINYNISH
ncbi:MAG: hypothetical protein GY803_12850 [Chloroflexi bacterium]|nr:hypothetical protein [Chloroflexota bacterium]